MDSIEVEFFFGLTKIKFGCSNLKDNPSQLDSERVFKYVNSSGSSGFIETYSLSDKFFCGIQNVGYGSIENSNVHTPYLFFGLLNFNALLCDAFDCRNKLQPTTRSLKNQTYEIIPGNTKFNKLLFSDYIINSDNQNCPINSCDIMYKCDTIPEKLPVNETNPDIWPITSEEIIQMAADYSNWKNKELFHVSTDPDRVFDYKNLCI